MLGRQALAGLVPTRDPDRPLHPAAQGPQRVEDHHHVDELLEHGSGDDRQEAEGRHDHRRERHAHPGDDALDGDPAGVPGDPDRLGEAVQAVHGDDQVGGLR
jgi:hypothetical protein